MMKNSGGSFRAGIDKAFSTLDLDIGNMMDANNYKQNFTEEEVKNNIEGLDQNQKDMVDGVIDIVKKVVDTNNRKTIANDMIEKFKKENIKFDYNKFLELCGIKTSDKEEATEATGSGSSGAYSAPLFSSEESDPDKVEAKEATGTGSSGGFVSPINFSNEFMKKSNAEKKSLTKESEVEKVEATEATGSGSSGGYESPAMWAKSTKKKDWGPSRKTQIPGGGFVKIKKKCTKFPYCNQGDINNLKISKNEAVKEAIENVSKKLNVSPNVIMTILEHEYENLSKRNK
jgi:hypothetical protein